MATRTLLPYKLVRLYGFDQPSGPFRLGHEPFRLGRP